MRLQYVRTVVVTAVLGLMMTIPGVALADAPTITTNTIVQENQPNPCDPTSFHTVTIDFTIRTHEHGNKVVRRSDAELSTDDGFVGSGHQVDVTVDGIRRITANYILHHPDTGERFSVAIQLSINLETGEIVEGSAVPTFQCIRAA